MASESVEASSRVPVTPAVHQELKEFRNGLGSSFDEAIALLLRIVTAGEDAYTAGKKLREGSLKVAPPRPIQSPKTLLWHRTKGE